MTPSAVELQSQQATIDFLRHRESYPDRPDRVVVHETHSAIVFLTGSFAYKLKKAVKFSFLDFTTLENRKRSCHEELRLNSRFAPDLYLDVIAVSRGKHGLELGGDGEIVDYIVRMRQFGDRSLFDDLAERGELDQSLLVQITEVIASFHLRAEVTPQYWGPDYVRASLTRNIETCRQYVPQVFDSVTLDNVRSHTLELFDLRSSLIRERQRSHVRELHGDLHLRNMCVFEGKATLFDGIDFNPELSHCDVFADFAFFVMDLDFRKRRGDAALVLNRYLQETDDYSGLRLLHLYVSYRAAVRAMVSCLELESAHSKSERERLIDDARAYLQLAEQSLGERSTQFIAVGGLAGSGKSTVSSLLAQRLDAVHIRSDAVRKHLCGVPLTAHAPKSAYNSEQTDATYRGLLERARYAVEAGCNVIVDAVYHSEDERARVESLAAELQVPFRGLWCALPAEIAKERVRHRVGDISDADESVVTLQETYRLGAINWHPVDTSHKEADSLAQALSYVG